MEINEWLVLFVLTLVAIGALLFASGSTGAVASVIGIVVAIAAVVGIMLRVKQYFDRADAARH